MFSGPHDAAPESVAGSMKLRLVTTGVLICGSHVRLAERLSLEKMRSPRGTDTVGVRARLRVAALSSTWPAVFVR